MECCGRLKRRRSRAIVRSTERQRMTKRLKETLARLILPLFFLLFFVTGIARSDTFRGALSSQGLDPQMPIVIELDNSDGILSGTVTISSPPFQGPIISGEVFGYRCAINSDV